MDAEDELGAAADPLLVRGRRTGEARERDQKRSGAGAEGATNHLAVCYVRASKWGSRALCPLMYSFFVMIILEVGSSPRCRGARCFTSLGADWDCSSLSHSVFTHLTRPRCSRY